MNSGVFFYFSVQNPYPNPEAQSKTWNSLFLVKITVFGQKVPKCHRQTWHSEKSRKSRNFMIFVYFLQKCVRKRLGLWHHWTGTPPIDTENPENGRKSRKMVENSEKWSKTVKTVSDSGKQCPTVEIQCPTVEIQWGYSGMEHPDPYHGGAHQVGTTPVPPLPRVPPTTRVPHCTGPGVRIEQLSWFTRLLLDTVRTFKYHFWSKLPTLKIPENHKI